MVAEKQDDVLTRFDPILSRDMSDDMKKHMVSLLDERDKEATRQSLERSKWRSSTPLAVALTGLITLTGNFAFDFWRGKAETANTVTLESLRQEIATGNDKLKAEIARDAAVTETNLSIKAEEKRFQFEIVRTEFAKPQSTEAERAKTLLFLARAGILNDLAVDEIKTMATEAIEREGGDPTQNTIPSLSKPPSEGGAPLASTPFTREQILTLAPGANPALADGLVENSQILDLYGISISGNRLAHFLAQIAAESGGFRSLEENLNYTAKALRSVWGSRYFPTDVMAEEYAHNPEKIANLLYGNRLGNGPPESGDGWRFRGRGLMQITGRANYDAVGRKVGIDLVSKPELLADPKYALLVAAQFWSASGLNEIADQNGGPDDLVAVTKRFTGGIMGLNERQLYFGRAASIWLPGVIAEVAEPTTQAGDDGPAAAEDVTPPAP